MTVGTLCARAFFAISFLLPVSAAAEKRIVILRSGDLPIYNFAVQGFTERLSARKIGFSLKDFTLPKSDGEIEAMIGAIRGEKPDLVMTIGTGAARAMRERGEGVPCIYAMIVDPPSLGITFPGAVMEVKPSAQIDFIRKSFPRLRRVGVVHSSDHNREFVRYFEAERRTDADLILIRADTPEEMSRAIQRLAKEADCLLMTADATLYSPHTCAQLILQAIQNGLPMIAVSPYFVKVGALAAIYPDFKDNGEMAGEVAERFFAGEKLGAIPFQWASKTKSAVNLVVAQRLSVPVPQRTIEDAEQVVK